MENNKELQELDDMLSELHDMVQEDVPDVEPDEELQKLLDLPEITVTPVVVKEPEPLQMPELVMEDPVADAQTQEAALEGDTVMFTPVAQEGEPTTEDNPGEFTLEDTFRIPDVDPAPTQKISTAEPAFEVEEEIIPCRIMQASTNNT